MQNSETSPQSNKKKSREKDNMKKSLFSLLFVLLIFFLGTSTARPLPRKAASIGPWLPIQNVSDPAVQSMGS